MTVLLTGTTLDLAEKDRKATAAALASGSPFDLLLLSASQDELDRAAAAILQDGGERVRYLFGLRTETRAIYQALRARKGVRGMADRLRRPQDDGRAARSHHPSLRHRRDR